MVIMDIDNFLNSSGFNLEELNPRELINNFIESIDNKLEGRESSLGMLNSYIRVRDKFTHNSKITVIDAGGTNLRVSNLIINSDNSVTIHGFDKFIMPGVEKEVTKDQFYTYIAEKLKPYIDYSDRVGFCFSYPVELHSPTDGKILRMCKEIKAPEVVGTMVCSELNRSLETLGCSRKEFYILNDSTATLLAGMLKGKAGKYGSYIGLILGTGSNSCYIEDNYIYNLESGWYSGLPRGEFDRILDKNSINPGKYYLEKATSGAYLGTLATIILEKLYRNGELDREPAELTTKDINDFVTQNNNKDLASDDYIKYRVFDRIIERSAYYIAINLAALIVKTDSREKSVYIASDGSTFHNLYNFQKRVEAYLDIIIDKKLKYEIGSVENAPVVGAAIAALLN